MGHTVFEGSGTAIITPMDACGGVDYDALQRLLAFQLESGTDAIVVNGTTGESATLEDKEKLEVMEFVIGRVAGRVPVIAGTGSNSTAHAVRLSKEAKRLGADALLQVTPYYNKTSQEGLVRHFTEVGDQAELPILLYDVPSRTGVTIQPETYKRLSGHPNIVGVKEAGGNISLIARTAAACGPDFAIYSGNDDQAIPIMALGGKGVVSVAANIIPRQVHEMCRMYLDGRTREAGQMQLRLLDLMDAMFWDVNPIPVKAALAMMGFCGENYRLPLVPMDEERKEQLRKLMESHRLPVKGDA